MLSLDHLTIIAPSLSEGIDHIRACLDLDIEDGRTHPEMGTHNRRLRLGDAIYLEVIAVDPGAPAPSGPRWFGLDDLTTVRAHWMNGERLRGWVAHTDDIAAVLAAHGHLLGRRIAIGRNSHFSLLPDGALPFNGVLPSVIDRAGQGSPVLTMTERGAKLRDFVLEHPAPAVVTALYERLGIRNRPRVQEGPTMRYLATIETAGGVKQLY
jgi:hypothetical protein